MSEQLNSGMVSDVELRAFPRPSWRGVEIHLRALENTPERRLLWASDAEMVPVAPGSEPPRLTVLREDAAQQLMDDLWCCGFRPTEGSGSAGALAATQMHLKDMQAIATKAMEVVLKHAAEPPVYMVNNTPVSGVAR